MRLDIDFSDEALNRDHQRMVVLGALEEKERAIKLLEVDPDVWRESGVIQTMMAIRNLLHRGEVPDLPAVGGELRALNFPDAFQSLMAVNRNLLPEYEWRHALQQTQRYHQRWKRALALQQAIQELNTCNDYDAWDERALSSIVNLSPLERKKTGGTDTEIIQQEIALIRKGEDREGFMDLEFEGLQERTDGFGPGQLVVLAAHPGDGKTTLAVQLAESLAINYGDVYFWSGEMNTRELARRRISALSGTPLKDITEEDLARAEALSPRSGRLYYECCGGKLETFLAKVHTRLLTHPNTRAVFVDYMGLLQDFGGNDTSEAGRVSDAIKNLAQQKQILVVAIQQPNRNNENRQDKTPRKTDLRDSNKIVQDAHKIIFIHRPWNYDRGYHKNMVHCYILKDRNGQAGGFIELYWSPATYQFKEWHTVQTIAGPKQVFKDHVQGSNVVQLPGTQPEFEELPETLGDDLGGIL